MLIVALATAPYVSNEIRARIVPSDFLYIILFVSRNWPCI